MQRIFLSNVMHRVSEKHFNVLHTTSRKRLSSYIREKLGTNHVKEYMLMKEFEKKKNNSICSSCGI